MDRYWPSAPNLTLLTWALPCLTYRISFYKSGMAFWIAWYMLCYHNRYHRTVLLYSLSAFQQTLQTQVVGPTDLMEKLESSASAPHAQRSEPFLIAFHLEEWSPTLSIHQDNLATLKTQLAGPHLQSVWLSRSGFCIFNKMSGDSHAASPGIKSWEALWWTDSTTIWATWIPCYLYLHFFLPSFFFLSLFIKYILFGSCVHGTELNFTP